MQTFITVRRKTFFILVTTALFATACSNSSNSNLAVVYRNMPTPVAASPSVESTPQPSPTTSTSEPVVSPTPINSSSADDPFTKENEDAVVSSSEKLMIPVVGVRGEDLRDTFDAARSEKRVHDAIDIIAARGTPVVAATNGKIVEFFDSARGGITIYQLSPDERTVYYYAHLDRRADGLSEGMLVNQGDLIGYVGDTGNSGAGNYHLHFAIWTITDPKRFYEGANVNPYLLLKDGITKPQ